MPHDKSISAIAAPDEEPDDGYYRPRDRVSYKVIPPDQPDAYRLYKLAETIRAESRSTVRSIVAIGKALITAQGILKENGAWVEWLKDEFEWSHQTAYNFINVAHLVEKHPDLVRGDFPPSALYLMSGAPESAVDDILLRAEQGHVTKGKALQVVRNHKWREAIGELVAADPGAAYHDIELKMQDPYYHDEAVRALKDYESIFAELASEDEPTVEINAGLDVEERYPDLPADAPLPPNCCIEENSDGCKVVVWLDGQPYTIAHFPRRLPPGALAWRNAAFMAVVRRLSIKTWEETL